MIVSTKNLVIEMYHSVQFKDFLIFFCNSICTSIYACPRFLKSGHLLKVFTLNWNLPIPAWTGNLLDVGEFLFPENKNTKIWQIVSGHIIKSVPFFTLEVSFFLQFLFLDRDPRVRSISDLVLPSYSYGFQERWAWFFFSCPGSLIPYPLCLSDRHFRILT